MPRVTRQNPLPVPSEINQPQTPEHRGPDESDFFDHSRAPGILNLPKLAKSAPTTQDSVQTKTLFEPKKLTVFQSMIEQGAERTEAAATVLQQRFKALLAGQKVRQAIVLPSEIREFLESNLGDLKASDGSAIDLDHLSRAIAREVLAFSEDATPFYGHGKRLIENEELYAFPRFHSENGNTSWELFLLPIGIWAKQSKDKRGIEIELIGQKLGEGTYKTVFQSQPLRIDLSSESHEKVIDNAVLVKAKPGFNDHVLRGIQTIYQNFSPAELLDPELRLAGLLTKMDRKSLDGLEARDIQNCGDLNGVLWGLDEGDKLQILADAATTLEKFHQKGLIHRDVKPPNILIGNDSPRGYLADFDLTQEQGAAYAAEYIFWDTLSENGYVTPFVDAYGLAQSAAGILFGADYETRKNGFQLRGIASKKILEELLSQLQAIGITKKFTGTSLHLILATIRKQSYRADLTSLQLRASEKIVKRAELLIRARNAIADVFDADERVEDYVSSSEPQILDLLQGDSADAKNAVLQLQTQFPEFANFFSEIKRIQLEWPG